ncbi:addiction module protein [Candidatus Methylobacter oryzae]|uniref:addiction module protein n=1 Tax=Candidatus Methylobacter oryzae TaxID=2497749 RepID=UPI0012B559AC|nr:addiction module protein [Candidatus Methylobacter oryzae]
MSIAELHKLSAVEKLRIIEALWGDLVGDEDNLPSLVWHETELVETEKNFSPATLRYWIGNKPRKNCVRNLNENPSSPASYRRPCSRPKIL